MAVSLDRIKTFRRWFGWTFVLTIFLLVPLKGSRGGDIERLVHLLAVLTSGTSLIGFVTTTIIAWRKERRESEHATIDPEKKQLELEKLRGEISDKNAAAQDKRKMTKRRRSV
jgi:hypothetical protein